MFQLERNKSYQQSRRQCVQTTAGLTDCHILHVGLLRTRMPGLPQRTLRNDVSICFWRRPRLPYYYIIEQQLYQKQHFDQPSDSSIQSRIYQFINRSIGISSIHQPVVGQSINLSINQSIYGSDLEKKKKKNISDLNIDLGKNKDI